MGRGTLRDIEPEFSLGRPDDSSFSVTDRGWRQKTEDTGALWAAVG